MSKIIIDAIFDIGDIVYLKTDEDQKKRIVTGISYHKTHILYQVHCGTESDYHYGIELTHDKDVVLSTSE